MKIRKIIYADEGKILTNGKTYGSEIFLAEGVSETEFYEITDEEYNALIQQKEENYIFGGGGNASHEMM